MNFLRRSSSAPLSTAERAAQLNLNIVKESLRQARQSFSLSQRAFQISLLMAAAGGLVSMAGVVLLLLGRAPEGTATTAGGIASGVIFAQLSKDARERLDNANARLDSIRYELWDGELTAIYYPLLSTLDTTELYESVSLLEPMPIDPKSHAERLPDSNMYTGYT